MKEKCYIISYELLAPQNVENALHTAIKDYGTWAKITDNTWAIVTEQSAVAVRDNLREFLTAGDRIFVVKSGIEAAWNNVMCSNEWLKRNL